MATVFSHVTFKMLFDKCFCWSPFIKGVNMVCSAEHDYDVSWKLMMFNSTASVICPRNAQGIVLTRICLVLNIVKRDYAYCLGVCHLHTLSYGQTGSKNVQLVLQHCVETSWIAMFSVLPPTNQACLATNLSGKTRSIAFKLALEQFCKTIKAFLLPVLPCL